ncbi:hypothetical protein ABEW33_27295 [Priestia megaterium]|uniref:hypothetical protein n=1 Tax=Priestia megaterium TaxID=1404 RepID=UPI0030C9AC5A
MSKLEETMEKIDSIACNEPGIELLLVWYRLFKLDSKMAYDLYTTKVELEDKYGKDYEDSEYAKGFYNAYKPWQKEVSSENFDIFLRIIELFDLKELFDLEKVGFYEVFSDYGNSKIDFEGFIGALKEIAKRRFVPGVKN